MTREEAKAWLNKLYARADITDEYGDMEDMQPYEEALRMAIKALEQELSGDLISRQEVFDLINDQKDVFYSEGDRGLFGSYVNELPPVNPQEPKWIPVSERLPEDKTYVLTTIKVPNRIAHARSGWYEGGFFHNDNGDTWKATDMEVIAWMPLPEPYKAESEDEE